METYNLWAGVGMTIKVAKKDRDLFLSDPETCIEDNLSNKDKVQLDGESYFPVNTDDNDLLEISSE